VGDPRFFYPFNDIAGVIGIDRGHWFGVQEFAFFKQLLLPGWFLAGQQCWQEKDLSESFD
jgi:hypothetical protein